jgi:hypothetical protein
VHENFGIAVGLEDRALADERVADLAGIDQIAVVRNGS